MFRLKKEVLGLNLFHGLILASCKIRLLSVLFG
jgi:hypothetical protein